jgi:arginine/lysine/ornithine decarboxylase
MDNQHKAPIYDALMSFKEKRIVPFDVPGHKRGKGNPMLVKFLGEHCLSVDVNSMKPLDNLCHPTFVIKEAEELAAQAFGAGQAFFMVNGTSCAVQSMVLSVCKKGDKIILPRNVHRSVINAIIICGAVPVYVNPQVNRELGISLAMSLCEIQKAIKDNPDAKAVFVNNPTYYGICSDLRAIVKSAHDNNMLVLADEAHGTHFYFGKNLPVSAMAAGADMAAVSMHKSGGSLTQSSFLLLGRNCAINCGYVRQIINLTQTTSASYLLLCSLDISRKYMALHGEQVFGRVCELANYARDEINKIGGFYAFAHEILNGDSAYDFDITKLSVNTLNIGLSGIEVYDILRDEYEIQVEFGDLGNLLAYISMGDRKQDLERLISAFADIHRLYKREKTGMMSREYITPQVVIMPQEAFYANKRAVLIKESLGEICCEFVMCYPPGIPILAPGERVTQDIIDYIRYAREKGCFLTGSEDMTVEYINVWEGKS